LSNKEASKLVSTTSTIHSSSNQSTSSWESHNAIVCDLTQNLTDLNAEDTDENTDTLQEPTRLVNELDKIDFIDAAELLQSQTSTLLEAKCNNDAKPETNSYSYFNRINTNNNTYSNNNTQSEDLSCSSTNQKPKTITPSSVSSSSSVLKQQQSFQMSANANNANIAHSEDSSVASNSKPFTKRSDNLKCRSMCEDEIFSNNSITNISSSGNSNYANLASSSSSNTNKTAHPLLSLYNSNISNYSNKSLAGNSQQQPQQQQYFAEAKNESQTIPINIQTNLEGQQNANMINKNLFFSNVNSSSNNNKRYSDIAAHRSNSNKSLNTIACEPSLMMLNNPDGNQNTSANNQRSSAYANNSERTSVHSLNLNMLQQQQQQQLQAYPQPPNAPLKVKSSNLKKPAINNSNNSLAASLGGTNRVKQSEKVKFSDVELHHLITSSHHSSSHNDTDNDTVSAKNENDSLVVNNDDEDKIEIVSVGTPGNMQTYAQFVPATSASQQSLNKISGLTNQSSSDYVSIKKIGN
jgi:hypothetical protein